ncbi:ParB/RepB/Spo0J family partition protein [Sphaerisporangium fuscum]|uniref:ParB/RepB/Spo0J family partition protein n=1 Tax=Sphaerisporangium fuscum TaxID=2835868 RepID=UPI0027E331F7|nr:ParB N-terminal domain-containing protein [Sphaerisporangium fuscum]
MVLPPVIVHRPSMRVVDGMHRLRAAVLRGEDTIRVRFFEGDERDAFVIAVTENTAHGLPLSASDRAGAVERIVRSHPRWSDRVIARITGLSARTVGQIRHATLPTDGRPEVRLGSDGRVRPLDSSAGRIRAAELISSTPHVPLREIARQAGISPGTVRDVRKRLERGEHPLPSSLRSGDRSPAPTSRSRPNAAGGSPHKVTAHLAPTTAPPPELDRRRASALDSLIKDPSLRSAEPGRLLLRMLSATATLTTSREQLMHGIPEHCVGRVYQAAKESAALWAEFADDLERRTARPGPRTEE